MSIPLLVYYVLAKMMSAIESAPLGNGITDPLVSSVELPDGDKLSNKMLISFFRSDMPSEEIINTGKYEGYIFNQNRCIQFNNRILCGYDKNKGLPLDDYTMIDIGSGCRARGDRLECGYDNPFIHSIIRNLRHPDFKNFKHGEHEEHGKHDVPYGEHDVPHTNHHHGDKLHNGLARQTPTRTAMTTNPTVPSTILDGSESDYLENITLLKSAFDKLVLKGEDTKIKSVKLATPSIKPIHLATGALKLVSTTTIKPIQHKSTLTPKREISKSSKATKTTLTSEITKTLATISESNNASNGKLIKRIVRLAPQKKQQRRELIETFSDSPKLISTDNPKSDTTTVSPISKPNKNRNEEKLVSACVEHGDRIVCYDFNKS